MSHPQETSTTPRWPAVCPLVVGTVHSAGSLDAATRLAGQTEGPNLIELRVDHFADHPEMLDALLASAPRPFIVTVRHPREGGAGKLASNRRRELYARFQGRARFIDVEIRSLSALAGVVHEARTGGGGVIASFHDFTGTPSLRRLRSQARRALDHGAHVLKIAATVRTAADLAVLLEFLSAEHRAPLALMGMGPLGRASRLILAAAGSVLNYGFLGETPQVSGQWPAALLRERINELIPPGSRLDTNGVINSLLAKNSAV